MYICTGAYVKPEHFVYMNLKFENLRATMGLTRVVCMELEP